MTTKATTKAGITKASAIRYKGPGYLALNVSNLEKSAWFYEHIVGLQPAGRTVDGSALFRCSDKHHDLLLSQSSNPGFKRMAWEMESPAARDAAFAHLSEIGVTPKAVSRSEAQELGISEDAFRIIDPTSGGVLEFFSEMEGEEEAYKPTVAKIQRLGHALLAVPDQAAAEKFYIEDLNFRVSDRIDGMGTHLRCFPNKWHHTWGVGKAPVAKLNHFNFMVTEIDDVGKAIGRMQKNNVPIVWGPGRHPQSGSIYFYFIDPDGMWVEYSYGMEEFPEFDPRSPRRMAPIPENIDSWGGAMPDPKYPQKGAIDSRL